MPSVSTRSVRSHGGSKGETLAEFGDLKDAGCVAVSDDGHPVANAEMLRRALEYALTFDLPLIEHSDEPALSREASMNEGPTSTALGLRGAPSAAETIAVERNVQLAELTGGRLHIAHISTAGAVDAVRRAKQRGVRVTAEVTPHHLLLTDELVRETSYDTSTKMNPPLRSEADREAVVEGLRDGTIDCIATDHAPHGIEDKLVEYDHAAFGIVGLETAVPLILDRLVPPGVDRLVAFRGCAVRGPGPLPRAAGWDPGARRSRRHHRDRSEAPAPRRRDELREPGSQLAVR